MIWPRRRSFDIADLMPQSREAHQELAMHPCHARVRHVAEGANDDDSLAPLHLSMLRTMRAGFPETTVIGGTSPVTTDPAPTTAPDPMVAPAKMIARIPIHTSSPMVIGCPADESAEPQFS